MLTDDKAGLVRLERVIEFALGIKDVSNLVV
jgi:hypothetical protein